jgi:dethiobiotin synthetase
LKTLLIAGTDTDVGKTVVTACLAAYFRAHRPQLSLGLMKLIQTGTGDKEFYSDLFGEVFTPLVFSSPVAPPIAAAREGKTIDLGVVWQSLQNLKNRHDLTLLEGIGGLGTPVTNELTVADLAFSWGLDCVLVVPVKLGAIAQTVANAALARQFKLKLKGIIFSCVTPVSEEQVGDWTPVELIESLTNLPVIGTVPYINNITDVKYLSQVASGLDLERIFPMMLIPS